MRESAWKKLKTCASLEREKNKFRPAGSTALMNANKTELSYPSARLFGAHSLLELSPLPPENGTVRRTESTMQRRNFRPSNGNSCLRYIFSSTNLAKISGV